MKLKMKGGNLRAHFKLVEFHISVNLSDKDEQGNVAYSL